MVTHDDDDDDDGGKKKIKNRISKGERHANG